MKSKVYNNPNSRAKAHNREYAIKLEGYSKAEIDQFLDGWEVIEDEQHNWIGRHLDGRRTALKGLRNDVIVAIICDEILCSRWPSCEHTTPQQCARARFSVERPKLERWRRAA